MKLYLYILCIKKFWTKLIKYDFFPSLRNRRVLVYIKSTTRQIEFYKT